MPWKMRWTMESSRSPVAKAVVFFGKLAPYFVRLWAPRAPDCFDDHRDECHAFPITVVFCVEVAALEVLVIDESSFIVQD